MFNKFLFFLLFIFFVHSYGDNNGPTEKRYFGAIIQQVNGSNIYLNNGILLKCDTHIMFHNISPVVFVIDAETPDGYFYLNGRKINFVLMSANSLGGGVTTLQDNQLIMKNVGFIKTIKNWNESKFLLTTQDGAEYKIRNDMTVKEIASIKNGDEILLLPERNGKVQTLAFLKLNKKVKIEEVD